jgi:hypothetical protein
MATNNFENGAESGSRRDYSDGGSPFRHEVSFSSEDFWAARNAHHGAGSNENLPNISISDNQNGGTSDSNQSSSQNSLTQELNSFLQEFEQFFQQFQQGGTGDSSATNNSPSSGDTSSSNADTTSNGGQSDNSQPQRHQPTDSTQPSQGGGEGDQSQQGSGDNTQQNNGNGGNDYNNSGNSSGSECNNSGNNGGADCNNSGGGTGDTTQNNGGSDSGTSGNGQGSGGSDTTQAGSGSDSTQSSTSGQSGTDCPTPNPSPNPSPTPTPPATPTIADQAASVVSQVDNSAQSGDFLGALTTLNNSEQAFKSSDPNDYNQYCQDLLNGIEHTNTSDGKTGADVMNALTEADIAYNWSSLSKPDGDHAYMDPQDLLNDVAASSDPVNKALLENGAANFGSLYGLGTVKNSDVANDMQLNEASFAQAWTKSF